MHCHTRFYIGNTPVLVTGNPDMVKEITIKQSANFMDRTVQLGLVCIVYCYMLLVCWHSYTIYIV